MNVSLRHGVTVMIAIAGILVAMPPANFLAHLIRQELESEPGQVIGLSSIRASAYLKHQIANRFRVSATDVAALVVGNDEKVLVLPQYCRISGIPIDQLLGDDDRFLVQTFRSNFHLRRDGLVPTRQPVDFNPVRLENRP